MGSIAHARIKKMSPQFLVTDIDRSVEFYIEKLGFDMDFSYENFYVGISKNGYSIHLKTGNPSIEERKNRRKNQDLDLIFSVEGIEDLYKELSGRFIEFTQPLRNMPYGKEFYIADPDGYILSFLEEA